LPRTFLLDAMPKRSVCAEIGVHLGEFSQRILDIVIPTRLHLIDPWKYEIGERYSRAKYGGGRGKGQEEMNRRYEHVVQMFRASVESGQVVIHREASEQASSRFPDGYFDWIYVDGNHLYEFVKEDLRLFAPKVKDGGFITGDDYESSGWWEGGVKKAVDEAIADGFVTVCEIKNGQFILRKDRDPVQKRSFQTSGG
jgi:hypothetical protein